MDKPMKNTALEFPSSRRRTRSAQCVDQVVGDILSGWRYDISGLSPAMRIDYEQHLAECAHCRRRQNVARTIDLLLLSVSTLSILAFLLAAVVIHRVELITHIFSIQVRLTQTHAVAISLEAVALAGMVFSALMWVLVAIATPLPGFLGHIVQERIPADIRERFNRNAA
ncbi:hypothetical protein GCM10011507_27640 [Edaphobacter acidisoli]|uniref:Zinc-finger domain-containing protein n=1 Tax=Edaphobacter acidisoli TaxID=2040573 RepID=A0A916W7C6_9BACT|nr:hypothetical protein [Edaphobacter acidisoli]GGA74707.1 hypothetical protein GCM10011507_27640 [Edaphobacter acidisoli]